ncbi:uncharacterized protein IL334_006544 [Kwoniella shivajii]|uniref:EamA domain-containing protein n=1 Tax=Kwoniella shivajii TaxID=564305 RepID=A0ABZ1D7H1_9TREE|nr:hypothetical protein IL334_006544 [Kwoniella shivajii]
MSSTQSSHIHIPAIAIPSSTKSILLPISILIGIVFSSAIQTEFAHHLSSKLQYDQPYFTFYLTHSTFSLIFPIHLLLLKFFNPSIPSIAYLNSIKGIIIDQLEIPKSSTWTQLSSLWNRKIVYLTSILSIPALSWYIAMALSPPVDITAIYSTSAFATYGFSMILLGTPLSKTTTLSILLAFTGVVVISIDGLTDGTEGMLGRVIGDSIMLFGAIILGLYEVIYKLALPEGHGGIVSTAADDYSPLPTYHSPPSSPPSAPTQHTSGSSQHENGYHRNQYPHMGTDPSPTPIELTPPLSRTTSNAILLPQRHHHHQYQVELPPALHSNFLTSCIGIATLLLLWPPIIALDWTGYEPFHWPRGDHAFEIWLSLIAVFIGGTLYNAGLMVLIGLWGPTTSSVANLLTIGLVALVDSIWLGQIPDFQTLLGVGMICIGFGVILWEGEG